MEKLDKEEIAIYYGQFLKEGSRHFIRNLMENGYEEDEAEDTLQTVLRSIK